MIKNILTKELLISKIVHKLIFIQLAILGANYLFSTSFCPTSLIELSRLVSIAILVIVLLVVVRPTKCLRILCSVFIILGFIIGFYYYAIILDTKTVIFDHHIYIKGDQLTEEAKKTLEENPEVTEKIYFNGVGRDQKLVWTEDSLRKNKWIVGGIYFLFLGLTGFGIFGGIEIAKLSQSQMVKDQKKIKKKR